MIRRFLFVILAIGVLHVPSATAATCDSLTALPLQNARVTASQLVAAGAFTPPAAPAREGGAAGRGGRAGGRGGNQPNPYVMLPAFCRVAMTLTPSTSKVQNFTPPVITADKIFVGHGAGNMYVFETGVFATGEAAGSRSADVDPQ